MRPGTVTSVPSVVRLAEPRTMREAILDRDPFDGPAAAIGATTVALTRVAGQLMHAAPGA